MSKDTFLGGKDTLVLRHPDKGGGKQGRGFWTIIRIILFILGLRFKGAPEIINNQDQLLVLGAAWSHHSGEGTT